MGEVRESIFFVFLIAVAIYTFSVFQSDFQDDFKISISGLLESYEDFEGPSLKDKEAEEDAYDFDTERSCNQTFYEQSHGDEGRLDPEKLTGIHIFIRHGHRTAMDSNRAKKTPKSLCDIRTPVMELMRDLKGCFTLYLSSKTQVYTSSEKCISSQLTSLGIEQHKLLGRYLQSRYSKFTSNFAVTSTTYTRTFLSALALLSTFDPSICSNSVIYPTRDTYFRADPQPCQSTSLLKNSYYEKTWANVSIDFRQKITKLFKETWIDVIADQLFVESCSSSFVSHQCKNSTSAKQNKCLSAEEIANFTSMVSSINYEYVKNINYQRNSFLSVKPLIEQVFANRDSFRLYSGHDLTLGAILSFFDFFPNFRVPFASRVVFEFFQGDKFRVLFNGVQIFPKLPEKVFPISEFSFEKKFQSLFPNSTSIQDACSKQSIVNFRRRKRHAKV